MHFRNFKCPSSPVPHCPIEADLPKHTQFLIQFLSSAYSIIPGPPTMFDQREKSIRNRKNMSDYMSFTPRLPTNYLHKVGLITF